MKICSLELSKKLYEAGLKLETEKWWCNGAQGQIVSFPTHLHFSECRAEHSPAPSTDELLEVMPFGFTIGKTKEGNYCASFKEKLFEYQSLSELVGLLCLWLLQNGYHYSPDKKELMKNE